MSAAAPADGVPAWIPVIIGSGMSYTALSAFSDGFRQAAETATQPPLYGYTTAVLYGLHALLPVAVCVVAAVLGAVAALSLQGSYGAFMSVGPVLLAFVAVRIYDSAKGPLPPILLTPVPTPAGDASGLMVLGWQADALTIAISLGASLLLGGSPTSGTTVVLLIATVSTLLFLTRRRLRRL